MDNVHQACQQSAGKVFMVDLALMRVVSMRWTGRKGETNPGMGVTGSAVLPITSGKLVFGAPNCPGSV
jgi:hypothetical protein